MQGCLDLNHILPLRRSPYFAFLHTLRYNIPSCDSLQISTRHISSLSSPFLLGNHKTAPAPFTYAQRSKNHKTTSTLVTVFMRGRQSGGEAMRNDHYFQMAKKDGYVARSVYKLQEIDEKHKLIRPGMAILDLGCAPGSWVQYTSVKVGPKGVVVGVDFHSLKLPGSTTPPNVRFYHEDAFNWKPTKDLLEFEPFKRLSRSEQETVQSGNVEDTEVDDEASVNSNKASSEPAKPKKRKLRFDAVVSDMHPATSGVRDLDVGRSFELGMRALQVALKYLKPNGFFLCKGLHGVHFEEQRAILKNSFEDVKVCKPKASKGESAEIFFLCRSKIKALNRGS